MRRRFAVDFATHAISLHYTTQSRSEHYEFSSRQYIQQQTTVTFCVTVSVTVQDRNGKTENGKTVTVQDRNGKTVTVGSQTAACYCLSRLFTESYYRFCHCYNTVSLLDGPEGLSRNGAPTHAPSYPAALHCTHTPLSTVHAQPGTVHPGTVHAGTALAA